jgi:hypothetical protein
MSRCHFSRDEMLRAVGMTENSAIQRVVAEDLHTSQNVILTARRQPNITVMQLVQRLEEDHQLLVSDQTVRRSLNEVSLHARRPLCVLALRHCNLPRSDEQWSLVLFTEESRFGFHPNSRRTRVWRTPGRVSRLRHLQEINLYQCGTIMM